MSLDIRPAKNKKVEAVHQNKALQALFPPAFSHFDPIALICTADKKEHEKLSTRMQREMIMLMKSLKGIENAKQELGPVLVPKSKADCFTKDQEEYLDLAERRKYLVDAYFKLPPNGIYVMMEVGGVFENRKVNMVWAGDKFREELEAAVFYAVSWPVRKMLLKDDKAFALFIQDVLGESPKEGEEGVIWEYDAALRSMANWTC